MADTKLSALSLGTSAPEYVYGIQSGNSRRYHAKQVVNVKDFGAVGDGSVDDGPEIQAAINAAFGTMPGSPNGQANPHLNKELYFPPGDYRVDAPLIIVDTKGAKIYGAGNGTTAVRLYATGAEGNTFGPDPDVTPLFELDGCEDIEFSDIYLACNRNVTLPWCGYNTTAGSSGGATTLTFTSTPASVHTDHKQLVYNYDDPDSIVNGTRVASKSGGTVTLDTALDSAVASGDRIYFVAATVCVYLFESGSNGVSGSVTFRHVNMSFAGEACVLVAGTTGCANGTLHNCKMEYSGLAGLRLNNPEALNWVIYGGGSQVIAHATTYRTPLGTGPQGNLGAAYSVVQGQISLITNNSTSIHPQADAAPEDSDEAGWAVINAGGHPFTFFGGRIENIRGIATTGGPVFVTGAVIGVGNYSIGVSILDCTFGGSITCMATAFNPSAPSPYGWAGEMGTDGVITFLDCQFAAPGGDDLGVSGSGNAIVSVTNCHTGAALDPDVLFASFTGRVANLEPECHGVLYADLPTANAKYKGCRGWITNCNTTTFNANAAGGGSSIVPVFCNGTNWKVG